VTSDNAPAVALYARIGFVTHHAYRYLAPTPAG
jgi:predicted GNAT family acetyltransferase